MDQSNFRRRRLEDTLRPSPSEIREARRKLACRLTFGLSNDIDSLHKLFERIEDNWSRRFELNQELFTETLAEENTKDLVDLKALIGIFEEEEQFEYCLVVLGIYNYFYSEIFKDV